MSVHLRNHISEQQEKGAKKEACLLQKMFDIK